MTGTILVTLDGSDLAERALPFAVALARRNEQRLVLLRIVPTYEFNSLGDSRKDIAAKLEASAGQARREGVAAETVVAPVVLAGGVADAIRDLARVHEAGMIVMSTHGRGGLGRWIYGSVADAVLRHAEVPVLLVPAGAVEAWPAEGDLKALVPLDGSPLAEAALGVAAELAETLLVTQVAPPINYAAAEVYAGIDWDAELVQARRYLDGVLAAQQAAGRMVVAVEPTVGPVASTIAELADENGADLIVMATHGRGGLSRMMLGSVATGVLRWAHKPVLLVRPEAVQRTKAAQEPALPVSFRLNPEELELLSRALGYVTFADRADPALARSAHDLCQRLHALRSEMREAHAAAAEPVLNP